MNTEGNNLRGTAEIIIAQNRNGDTGIVRLKFNGEYSKFENLAYIIHSGFISGYQNRYGDNLKPPT
ncbi:DnaB-like helicase C-terminal domain-containing protein, partial [Bacteroides uniformis]|uniref:DnaB-like helicase C-terminal domain-containing protein n=1 Tax=Bacteroides uniformis TaxID=820 RepID=UPI003F23E995